MRMQAIEEQIQELAHEIEDAERDNKQLRASNIALNLTVED
jgi:hypothetical protein